MGIKSSLKHKFNKIELSRAFIMRNKNDGTFSAKIKEAKYFFYSVFKLFAF